MYLRQERFSPDAKALSALSAHCHRLCQTAWRLLRYLFLWHDGVCLCRSHARRPDPVRHHLHQRLPAAHAGINEGDAEMAVGVGENLALEEIPVLEVEDNEMYSWVYVKPVTSETLGMNETEEVLYLSEQRLTGILFDQTYEAEFEAKHMVSQGEEKTEDNHSIILAVGAFDKNTTITLTDMLANENVIDKVTLKENWQVTISNIGVKKLHYRIPTDMQADKIQLFVKDASGTWTEREYIVEGSYIVFDFAESETGFALAETSNSGLYVEIIAAAVIVVIIIGVVVSKKRKQRVVKKGNTE